MPDWPQRLNYPPGPSFSTLLPSSLFGDCQISTRATISTGVWPVANKALFCAVWLETPCLAQILGINVAVQSGNIDLGLYSEQGSLIVSSGSTPVAVAGKQALDIADTWVGPGTIYLAMSCDNVVASFSKWSNAAITAHCAVLGLREMASAFPLPATATFANVAAAYFPHILVGGAVF